MATNKAKPSGTSTKKKPANKKTTSKQKAKLKPAMKKAPAKKPVAKKSAVKKPIAKKPIPRTSAPLKRKTTSLSSATSPLRATEKPAKVVTERSTSAATESAPAARRSSSVTSVGAQTTVPSSSSATPDTSKVNAFLRQLIMMLEAGTPILKSLRTLEQRSEDPRVRSMVKGIAEYVEAGNPLWQAFARDNSFPRVFTNSIKAAEASGTLTTVLERLVKYRESREILKKRVRSAMYYPATVALVCFGVLVVIARFVIPQFEEMFKNFDVELSGWTLRFMQGSELLATYWWVIVIAIIGVVMFYRLWWVRDPGRRLVTDRLWLRVPLLGDIFLKRTVVDFTRSLALMLRSGISMRNTLELCRDSVGNRAFYQVVQDMRDSVERGEGLEAPLRKAHKDKLLPGVVADMLITGEETGTVDKIADQVADTFEEEANIAMSSLNEMIQPIVTLAMGVIVAGIVFSIFGPLVQMIEKISTSPM